MNELYLPVLYAWDSVNQCWHFQTNNLIGTATSLRRMLQHLNIPTLLVKKWHYSYFRDTLEEGQFPDILIEKWRLEKIIT